MQRFVPIVLLVAACGSDQRQPTSAATTTDAVGEDATDGVADSSHSSGAPNRLIFKLRSLDVHRAARFIASVTHENVVVIGGSVDEHSFDIEATSGADAITELARLTGLEIRPAGELTLLGTTGSIAQLGDQRYGGTSRAIDIDFCVANAGEVLRLLSDISQMDIEGTLRGAVTVLVRDASSTALLDIFLSLSGAPLPHGGPVRLPSNAALPPVVGLQPTTADEVCPVVTSGRPIEDRMVLGACVPVDAFELRAVALAVGREPTALLVPRHGVRGPSQGLLVRRGHFVGQPRFDPSGEDRFWRVEAIDENSVRFILVLDNGEADYSAPPLTLPLVSGPRA